MSSLRAALNDLATSFINGTLAAIRSANVEDLLSESGSRRGPGRPRGTPRRVKGQLARRPPEQIQETLTSVVSLLKSKKDGLRSEEIRDVLKLDKREVPRILKTGLASKKLKSKGQKRATVYRAA